jgi:TatA/E family protein of Tat protein translocase
MMGLGTQELIVILIVALLVFGPKRLPELGRTLGKGLAELRRAMHGVKEQIDSEIQDIKNPVSFDFDNDIYKNIYKTEQKTDHETVSAQASDKTSDKKCVEGQESNMNREASSVKSETHEARRTTHDTRRMTT